MEASPQLAPATPRFSRWLIVSFALLCLVILGSGILYGMRALELSRLGQLREQISAIEERKQSLISRPDIVRAQTIMRSASGIEDTIAAHRIDRMITLVERIQGDAGIRLDGFNYAGGKITTRATASGDLGSGKKSIDRIIDFLATYRAPTENGKPRQPYHFFTLAPVWSIDGNADARSFSIDWTLNTPEFVELLRAEANPAKTSTK